MNDSMESNSDHRLNVRRSIRERLPNSDLITRRSILSSIPAPKKALKKTVPTVSSNIDRKSIRKDILKSESMEKDQTSVELNANEPNLDDIGTPTKKVKFNEIDDEPKDNESSHMVVTKNAGFIRPKKSIIQPFFFATESKNSGIILFNSKRKANLNISFPKCFVILSGQFQVDGLGLFNPGDFIKAPAGSQIGFTYMKADKEDCGRIIFYKSQL